RDRGSIERLELLVARDRRYEPCVQSIVFGRASDVVFEIGGDLEEGVEIGVERLEQVEEQPIAEQDDLHVERNRLGLERDRAREAERLPERLDPDLLAIEGALEPLPSVRCEQEIARVEHEISAARPMERPRLDQVEVGDEGPEPLD